MASKRNLYRPAQVQENVGQQKPRKTLAQGRLITNSRPPTGFNAGSNPSSGLKGGHTGGVLTQGHLNTSNVSTGSISGLHASNSSLNNSHHTSLIQGRLEGSLFSPRREVPMVSEERTPNHGGPAGSLDLTDSEAGDEMSEPRSHYPRPSEVLWVDASRRTLNPDVSEVDIRIGVDASPVKIVCHSPSRINHTRQNHGKSTPSHADVENMKIQSHKKSIIIKEKVADDHIDPYTAVQSVPMSPNFSTSDRKVLQSLPSNISQPNFSDSGGSDVLYVDHHEHDKMSVRSEDDSVSLKDNKDVVVTNHKLKIGDRTPGSAKKIKGPETAKKKKPGRVIPSRFMQAMETKVKTSLSSRMEKTSTDSTKGSRSLDMPQSTRKVARNPRPASSSSASASKKEKETRRPSTPENQSMASSTGGKTSTPTMDCSNFTHEMDIDASAIHPEASILAGGHGVSNQGRTRSRLQHDLADDLLGQSIVSNVSIYHQSTVSSKPKQKKDAKSAQKAIDLQYMFSQQWAFLEAKAKQTLHEQEQQAMAQIYGVYEEVEKLRKEKTEKDKYLARLQHTNNTDHMAEVQRQCLGPVVNSLPELQKQYSNLAYALDTTRHQIPMTEVYVPDNKEQFEAKLEAHLLESERLLGEISSITRQDVPNIVSMGTALSTMEQSVETMKNELKKSEELLAAVETLTIQECSLRVQSIQTLELT
ncbi:uncharacterized protein LOC127841978 isoform X2 [Dreissena polymorpha]|uniref:uncharacterized protein LOC127841978 isoform X2 n=1 Tax=Dreissena polymorpha TaxID=45954 RepID=UPI00226410F5|nr:uncharacterized protein LOC127841978 isoform X2 [Dreissena polymorpha]